MKKNHNELLTRISQKIFAASIDQTSLSGKIASFARRRLIGTLGKYTVSHRFYNSRITLPFEHQLLHYIRNHPNYDRGIYEIASRLMARDGYISAVDIGANIGDTALAIASGGSTQGKTHVVCIEPNTCYMEHLRHNLSQLVSTHFTFDSFQAAISQGGSLTNQTETLGTCRLRPTNHPDPNHKCIKLDDLLLTTTIPNRINLLKIDTDGHDLDVIHSGLESIKHNKPIILFECDDFGDLDTYRDKLSITLCKLREFGYLHIHAFDNLGNPIIDLNNCADSSRIIIALSRWASKSRLFYMDILVSTDIDEEIARQTFATLQHSRAKAQQ